MPLGEKLLQLRKAHGLSQEQLAAKIMVSRQAISKWELGETMPDTENVVQLGRALGVTTDFLLIDEINTPTEIPVIVEVQKNLERPHRKRAITVASIGLCALGVSILLFAKWPLNIMGFIFFAAAVGLLAGSKLNHLIFKRHGEICPMCGHSKIATNERDCNYCGWVSPKR